MERPLRFNPPTYAPSLVLSYGKKYHDQIFCTLFDGDYHVKSVPEMRGMRCVISSHGWLLLQSYSTTECYLFNPVLLTKSHLPPLIDNTFKIGFLTSSPTDPGCFVVFYSNKKRSLIFCKVGATTWIQQELWCEDRKRKIIDGDCDSASCNGKIYLSFFGGMAVIDVRDTFASVELFERKFLDHSLPDVECHHDFIVESCGEIFKVVGLCLGSLSKIIRKFDVYKLDVSNMMDWVRVESIGKRIFLLGQSSTSLSTAGLSLKGNRIYLTLEGHMTLYMFDMDDGTMTTSIYCPKKIPHWRGPFWVVPNCEIQVKKDAAEESNNKEESWKNLEEELLELILSSLSLGDHTRFRLTCKTWMSITPLVLPSLLPGHSNLGPQQIPWLMLFPYINKGVCRLYHPIYSDTYTMNLPELEGAVVRNAKYGWLLMSRGDYSIFFFNPLTKETIQLPDLEHPYAFAGISFSAPPNSPYCLVLGINNSHSSYTLFLTYHKFSRSKNEEEMEDTWYPLFIEHKVNFEFMPSNCNPIYYNGVFYCLSQDGRVGCYSLQVDDVDLIWQVLPVPQVFPYTKSQDFSKPVRSFIVEYEGEILSVFMDSRGKPIWVYRLDQSKENMKWVLTKCLEDKVLFHSSAACILESSKLKGVENRIYLSKFHEENNVFYSLSSEGYHCLKCQSCRGDCSSICEMGNCTWIQLST